MAEKLVVADGAGTQPWPNSGFLLALAESAAGRARAETDLQWAAVAVRLYESASSQTHSDNDSALRKAMNLRSWFISHLGVRRGDLVLDPDTILKWCEHGLKFSLEETRRKISRWQNSQIPIEQRLNPEELRNLRAIKNRLYPVRILFQAGYLDHESPLFEWLDVQGHLP